MNKDFAKELMYILIAVILGILAVKFVIWLLPIVLFVMCSYYIYKSIKKNRKKTNQPKTKKKNIKIIEMIDDEK